MLPRPSRLKSLASELSPVLTTPPPVDPNTVLVLMSVPEMMLSSNLVVLRRRAAMSAAMPARTASAPAPMAHGGVPPNRSSKNPGGSFGGALTGALGTTVFGGSAAGGGTGSAAFGGSTLGGSAAFGGSAGGGSTLAGSAALGGSGAFTGSAAFGGSGALTGSAALGGLAAGAGAGTGVGACATTTGGGVIAAGGGTPGAGALPFAASACACALASVSLRSSTARCRSFTVFSSSATRLCDSRSWASRATVLSAAPPPLPAPSFDTRNWSLPGRAAGVRSSTAVPIRPPAARPPPSSAIGAAPATRSRYARQSDACTRTVRVASDDAVDDASTAFGIVMIAPERSRFMLLPSNAPWLLLNSATSIWSSVTVSGLYCAAIFDSVSPRFTEYVSPSPRGAGALAAPVAAGARAAGAACVAVAGAAPVRSGVIGSTGGEAPLPGGSSRNV